MERPRSAFTGIKVFSATMVAQRVQLGDQVTQWLSSRPHLDVVEALVRQSSDSRFHCISIIVFYRESDSQLRT